MSNANWQAGLWSSSVQIPFIFIYILFKLYFLDRVRLVHNICLCISHAVHHNIMQSCSASQHHRSITSHWCLVKLPFWESQEGLSFKGQLYAPVEERLPPMYQLGLKKRVFDISPVLWLWVTYQNRMAWEPFEIRSYAIVTVCKSRLVDLMVCLQSKVPCSSTRPNAQMRTLDHRPNADHVWFFHAAKATLMMADVFLKQ